MFELTDEQRKTIDDGQAVRVHENGREYVLLHPKTYENLANVNYDDDSWTADEMDRLREESVEMLDRFGSGA